MACKVASKSLPVPLNRVMLSPALSRKTWMWRTMLSGRLNVVCGARGGGEIEAWHGVENVRIC